MDKRLFLAVFLSLMVLFVWSVFTGPVKKSPEKLEMLQRLDSKEVARDSSLEKRTAPPPPTPDQPILEAPATGNTEIINTENFVAQFSDIGGNLKSLEIIKYNHVLPVKNLVNVSGYESSQFQLVSTSKSSIVYRLDYDDISIIKEYAIDENDYSFSTLVRIVNNSEMSKEIKIDLDSFEIDSSSLDKKAGYQSSRYGMLMEYSIANNGLIERKRNVSRISAKETKVIGESVDWLGFRDQYFCTIVKPNFDSSHYYVSMIDEKRVKLGVKTDEISLRPGGQTEFELLVYYGPQDIDMLKRYESGFEKIVNYKIGGFFDFMAFGLTDVIAKVLLKIVRLLHKIVPNWGVCIILFAFFIYGITYPLTRRSMVSMRDTQKRMQVLQPEIKKIQEKHKNNPQKIQQETMEFYKKHNFNPLSMLGGCLPMFFQMPIFVSLYQVLWRSYFFKGAGFLWIKDLSEPDRLFILPFKLPFLGNEFNILPIVYGGLMVVQQKFSSKNMPATDPSQAEMQRMMAKFFPIMLGFIFYKFASGLTLYFVVYFALTTFSQWKMSKTSKAD